MHLCKVYSFHFGHDNYVSAGTVVMAMGLDSMHSRVQRELADVVVELFIIFEKPWLTGGFLDDWKKGNLTPIYKKGRKNDLGN